MCDVMILEDDAFVRAIVAEVLVEAGFSVVEASCLREAREVASSISCRVLMVDHDLGEADRANGFDFARERLAASEDVSAIYVTARWNLFAGYAPSARERHLRKPFRMAELVHSVRELVSAAV